MNPWKDEDMKNTIDCLHKMAEAEKLKPKLGEKFELNQASEAHIRTIENKGCLGKKYFEFSHWTDRLLNKSMIYESYCMTHTEEKSLSKDQSVCVISR